MRAAKGSPVRSYFDGCVSGRSECSGKQIRNGLFVLNMIGWIIILGGIELLT